MNLYYDLFGKLVMKNCESIGLGHKYHVITRKQSCGKSKKKEVLANKCLDIPSI